MRNPNQNADPCLLCEKINRDGSWAIILRKALYSKYSQSQNYYYQKDVNEILDQRRISSVIQFKDEAQFSEYREYLRKFYSYHDIGERFEALTEYYKYHINLPRNFYSALIGKRNEKNREIEYERIKRDLGLLKTEERRPAQDNQDSTQVPQVSGMTHLLRGLNLESTANTTILRDLVQMIPDSPKRSPYRVMQPAQSRRTSLQLNQMHFNRIYQTLILRTQQNKIGNNQNFFQAPATTRPQLAKHSRQGSGTLTTQVAQSQAGQAQNQAAQTRKNSKATPKRLQTNPMKSRQTSMGNVELTKSSTILFSNKYCKEAVKYAQYNLAAAKQLKSQKQNFYCVGTHRQGTGRQLFKDDLRRSEIVLSRRQTPSKLCTSKVGSPNQKLK